MNIGTMRSSKSRSRNKSRNNPRSLGNIVNRVFDSSGPEGKVRGTPQQIIEKYLALARDAQLSGDRVAEQSFLQHAEHYTRMLGEAQREQAERQAQFGGQGGLDGREERNGQPYQDERRDDRGEGRAEGRSDVRGDGRNEPRGDNRRDDRAEGRNDNRPRREDREGRGERRDDRDDSRRDERAEPAPVAAAEPVATPEAVAEPAAPGFGDAALPEFIGLAPVGLPEARGEADADRKSVV